MNIRVIVNPRAGAGRAGREIAELKSLLAGAELQGDVVLTQASGHATKLAQDAIQQGVGVLAVLGGDGTFNEVSQAFIDPQGQPVTGPDLALIPCGTGGDLRRTFNLSNNLRDAVERILHGRRQSIDLGVAEFVDHQGKPARRSFLNVASFGISGEVANMANRGPKWLGGKMTFLGATLVAAVAYRNRAVTLSVNGEPWYQGRVFAAAFANGQYFGGGMKVAPDANPASGHLDAILVQDLSKLQAYALTTHLYDGSHLNRRKIELRHGTEFLAEPLVPGEIIPIEIDGETPGNLPLCIKVHPSALTLRV